MILNILFILFFIYIIHSGYLKYRKSNDKQLNGPMPIPILGNLHQLGRSPHIYLTELHKKYGSIYRVFFGDVYTVIVSDPVLIREMMVDNHETFQNRPYSPTFQYGNEYYGISISNERWPRTRELVMKAIRKTSIKKIYDMLDGQVDELIKSMKQFEKTSEPFEMHLFAQRFTLSIMFKYIFNEDVSYDEDITKGKIAELAEPMNAIIKSLGAGKLGDYVSILQPLYYKWLCLTEKSFPKVKKFINTRYQEHLDTIDKEDPRDLLDILINEYSKDEDSIKTIVATCFDMFIAGNDTTAASIIWFTLRMQENPEIQEKAYQELKSVVGDRSRVKLGDRPSTPYLNAIIKEGLRLNPVGPFGLPHSATNDITIGNGKYFIPNGAQIFINYRGLGFNEKYFENPEQYNPSRFLNNNSDAYMPFGAGTRMCVGMALAQDELYLSFSNILLNFKLINTGTPVDDTEEFGLTLKPKKFKVLLESR